MGSYGAKAQAETFIRRRGNNVPEDIASLAGVRYVVFRAGIKNSLNHFAISFYRFFDFNPKH